jgi:tetratricopeptide (TPR) repeat protein
MRKIAFILLAVFSFSAFAQKSEVKTAEKLFKKGEVVAAKEAVEKACKLIGQADDKTKARIMFAKGEIYSQMGTADVKYFETAVATLNKLKSFEKKIDKNRYSDDANVILTKISVQIDKQSYAKYKKKEYEKAAKLFDLQYVLGKNDYSKYSAAISYLLAEKYENSLKLYKELYKTGYTGVTEFFSVKNVKTGKRERANSKAHGNILIKTGEYADLKKEKTQNIRPDIVANILFVYGKLGQDDNAMKFIGEAKKEDPNNIDLIIGEGNYYLKKGDNAKFAAAMKKAVSLDPNNKVYNFNLGTAYYQLKDYANAKIYFEKTIELDPAYLAAYKGLSYVILAPDDKITKEMNKDEVLMNDRLYNKYMKQHKDIYRKVLPVLEKAYGVDNNDYDIVRMLKSIYSDLDMNAKAKEFKAKYKVLKQKQVK